MAVEERFTELPAASTANLTDIICAVQGYTSPSNLGLSTQQTLQQIYNLFANNVIQYYAGNPNGNVAGNVYGLLWDTVDNILWVCTTTGTTVTAVWKKSITLTAGSGVSISQAGSNITISSNSITSNFVVVSTTSASMVSNTTYQPNNVGLVTLTLPPTSSAGDRIAVCGYGSGKWIIAQNAGQNIQIGNVSSTVGVGGSVAAKNQYDSITLICSLANTSWQALVAPQGTLTVV